MSQIELMKEKLESATGLQRLELLLDLALLSNRSSPDDTARYASDAMRLADELNNMPGLIQSVRHLGSSYLMRSDLTKAESHYQRALDLCRLSNNREQSIPILVNLATVRIQQGNYDAGKVCLTKALDLKCELKSSIVHECALHRNMGGIDYFLGDYHTALTHFLAALECSSDDPVKSHVPNTLTNIASIYAELKEYEKALDYYLQVNEMYEKNNNLTGLVKSLRGCGSASQDLGHYEQALEYFQRALKLAESTGLRRDQAYIAHNIGNVYLDQGKPELALEILQESLKLNQDINDQNGLAAAHIQIGVACFRLGDRVTARQQLLKGLEIARDIGSKKWEQDALFNLYNRSYA